jgi:hypothetical protein
LTMRSKRPPDEATIASAVGASFVADHIDQSVALPIRLDELVRLIQARILDLVLAERYAGDTNESDFYDGRV